MSATVATPVPRALDERLFTACGLSWMAAVIHLVAAAGHRDEYLLYPVFFILLAGLQAGWGVAVYRSASPPLLWTGAIVNLLVVAIWVVSRTSGIPLGPERWSPESAGALDVIATADELALAALVFLQLRGSRLRRPAGAGGRLCAALGVCLILLSSLALIGGHAH